MRKQASYLLFSLGLVIVFFTGFSDACQCMARPPIYESYETASAVFSGKVVASNLPSDRNSYDGGDIIFDIEVLENLKGAKTSKIRLNRGSMNSSCYSGYTVGESYLFYASSTPDFGFFEDKLKGENVVYQGSACNRNSSLKSAQDQLTFLREMAAGKPESQIYGSVARSDSDPTSREWRFEYFKGVSVVLEGTKKFTTISDDKGIFRFRGIPPGEYVLKAEPSADYKVTSYPDDEVITILPDGTISEGSGDHWLSYKAFYYEIWLGWNNHLDGNILDSNGIPLDRYVIKMLPVSGGMEEMVPSNVKGSPDASMKDGYFVFGRETPGKYLIAVEVYLPSDTTPKRRFFFPGTTKASMAQVFDIQPTTTLTKLQMRIPLVTREIKGEMRWSDGTTVGSRGGAVLSTRENVDDPNNVRLDWTGLTDNGRFALQAYDGFEYWIQPTVTYFTTKETGSRFKQVKAKPIKLMVGENMVELKVIFDKPADFSCEHINDCVEKRPS